MYSILMPVSSLTLLGDVVVLVHRGAEIAQHLRLLRMDVGKAGDGAGAGGKAGERAVPLSSVRRLRPVFLVSSRSCPVAPLLRIPVIDRRYCETVRAWRDPSWPARGRPGRNGSASKAPRAAWRDQARCRRRA